jgi:hypothetical protein
MVSTRKLVDTAAEQELLEKLIDRVKPPDATSGKLHYLLATPFRYPPLRHGSRFASRLERGIWYGSDSPQTLFAEVSYYRMVFLEGTTAKLAPVATLITTFQAAARTNRGVDLTRPPFSRYRERIASPTSYAESQALGRAMRDAGVELFRYPSARDPERGANVAVLNPAAFGRAKPRILDTWHCSATREVVELAKADYFGRETYVFERETFLVGGSLPAPAP